MATLTNHNELVAQLSEMNQQQLMRVANYMQKLINEKRSKSKSLRRLAKMQINKALKKPI